MLAGCTSMGPASVARDRLDYISSMSDSWKRQTPMNLVKTRYADAPVFLDVASVITSYSWEAELNLSGQIGRGDPLLGLGTTGRYADRPTITYAPLRMISGSMACSRQSHKGARPGRNPDVIRRSFLEVPGPLWNQ